uniref:Uncharacterized protein n=1 Tax=Chromera velia CCMP2878 TaxID=1169474 RepID=A0A0G4G0U4_9ALVE|eukprot:Cvel_19659.t1-p1 / transcript=Cvel_19659.t1 / gene=Cvel_19659 / organism=Chromera_velia_CCMP2878 / gene_product=hypothetical protein / transcript_product=hypothetical protein / location=Cvel_scaffold1713:40282-40824(+) / protein_length=181 / sequence_SO=supercontig / SO=protein_coding / is_pseudo=false
MCAFKSTRLLAWHDSRWDTQSNEFNGKGKGKGKRVNAALEPRELSRLSDGALLGWHPERLEVREAAKGIRPLGWALAAFPLASGRVVMNKEKIPQVLDWLRSRFSSPRPGEIPGALKVAVSSGEVQSVVSMCKVSTPQGRPERREALDAREAFGQACAQTAETGGSLEIPQVSQPGKAAGT